MKIKIVCVGKIKEKYLNDGISEFLKRLKPYAKIEVIEVSETKIVDNPSAAQVLSVVDDEATKLMKYVNQDDYLIILDVVGKIIDNTEYVELINKACLNGKSTFTFIIGGSYGISESIRKKADFKWSFSKLTFTHQMIRLLLLEQIYRGFKIMGNEPYHK